MFLNFVNSNVKPVRAARAENQREAIDRINDPLVVICLTKWKNYKFNINFQEQYDKLRPNGSGLRRCSFFDPNVPNGGPRPDDDPRSARSSWAHDILCQDFGEGCPNSRKRRAAEFDPFDAYEAEYEAGERSINLRLADDPALALRQVL